MPISQMSYLFQEVHKEGDGEAGNYVPNKNTYIAFFNRLLQCFYSSFLRGNIIHPLWTTIESCARMIIYYFSTQGRLSFGFVFGIESVSISIRNDFVGNYFCFCIYINYQYNKHYHHIFKQRDKVRGIEQIVTKRYHSIFST